MSPRANITAQEWFTAAELADLKLPGLPSTKRGVQMVVDREGWASYRDASGAAASRKRAGRGGGLEYHVSLLPEAARNKLLSARPAKVERPDLATMQLRYERLPQSLKDRALFRLGILRRVEELQRQGARKEAAIEVAAAEVRRRDPKAKVSVRTVHEWFDLVAGIEAHNRLVYLAPAYAGRQSSTACDPLLWDAYKEAYLQLNKAPHPRCYAEVSRIAKAQGLEMPSAKYFIRRIAAEIPPDQLIYLREGVEASKHTFAHADRDRSGLYPLKVCNLDGHTMDVFVQWEDGTVSKPVGVAVQDIYSGMWLAIRMDRTLSQHLVRLALGDTIRDYGLPHRLIMDNGSENQAAALAGGIPRLRNKAVEEEPAGLFLQLGIAATFAQPRHGQAKPIERMFRDVAHNINRSVLFKGAYAGHNTLSKPEDRAKNPMPFAEFERLLRIEMEYYNDQTGRTGVGKNGRSFRQMWNEGVVAHPPRQLTADQLRICMLRSSPRPMDRQSGAVSIMDHRFWSPELSATKRQRVFVRFDPADLSKPVYVYALDGRFLAEAPRVAQGDFESYEKAQAIDRARRRHMKLVAKVAKSQKRLGVDAYGRLLRDASSAPEPVKIPEGATNVVAGAFGLPRNPTADIAHTDKADEALMARARRGWT